VDPAAAGGSITTPVQRAPHASAQAARVIKSGNIIDLISAIEESHGDQIAACFDGLDGDGVAASVESS
jgi:hypothetical protein